ncbi:MULTISPECIES: PepSY domain-containing protein [unclassified Rhizobium]|uniref:PepSY domain-containing protein n=1 Tax=unclassified Rhizobium TaxID=2613769 RepID=UPI000714CA0D|nr:MULTISPECIES: PepSY domain-containing protein [unclassified Rhizobium]KQV38010.1 hypothetical protein ASC86_07110 [Rhizobium sp. Root1212]KRD30668.1 hypothetical protein ASE37_07105 [Rhizobium sp. Root268]
MKHARYTASGRRAKTGLALAVVLGLTFGHAAPLHADDDDETKTRNFDETRDILRDRVQKGEIKSLAELRHIVLSKVPGDIVSTSVDQEYGVTVYDFRVLNSVNRLIEVEVDAASGMILEIENDE